MEWIREPGIETNSFCVIQICSAKNNCDEHLCVGLACNKNS